MKDFKLPYSIFSELMVGTYSIDFIGRCVKNDGIRHMLYLNAQLLFVVLTTIKTLVGPSFSNIMYVLYHPILENTFL